MLKYIQAHANGLIHTIFETDTPFPAGEIPPRTTEVSECTLWYHGAVYDGEVIAKLTLEGVDQTAANQEINLTVKWVSIDGETVPRTGIVAVACGDYTEEITISEGIGSLPFESAEPGEYLIMVTSPEGCRAEKKVTVA